MGIKCRPHACKTRTLWSDLSSAPMLRSSKFFSLFLSVSCTYTLYYEHNILVRKSLWGWREITHKVWRGRAGVRVELTPVTHFQREDMIWGDLSAEVWRTVLGERVELKGRKVTWEGKQPLRWKWEGWMGVVQEKWNPSLIWSELRGLKTRLSALLLRLVLSEAGAWLVWQWPGALRRACGV